MPKQRDASFVTYTTMLWNMRLLDIFRKRSNSPQNIVFDLAFLHKQRFLVEFSLDEIFAPPYSQQCSASSAGPASQHLHLPGNQNSVDSFYILFVHLFAVAINTCYSRFFVFPFCILGLLFVMQNLCWILFGSFVIFKSFILNVYCLSCNPCLKGAV